MSARWMLSMRRWGRRLIRWCWHCWLQCANAFDLSVLLSVKHQDIEIAKSPSLIFTELKIAKKTSTGTIIFLHWLPWRWAQRWLYCQQELIYISLPTFIITPQVTESKLIIAPRVNQFEKKGQTRFALLIKSMLLQIICRKRERERDSPNMNEVAKLREMGYYPRDSQALSSFCSKCLTLAYFSQI